VLFGSGEYGKIYKLKFDCFVTMRFDEVYWDAEEFRRQYGIKIEDVDPSQARPILCGCGNVLATIFYDQENERRALVLGDNSYELVHSNPSRIKPSENDIGALTCDFCDDQPPVRLADAIRSARKERSTIAA